VEFTVSAKEKFDWVRARLRVAFRVAIEKVLNLQSSRNLQAFLGIADCRVNLNCRTWCDWYFWTPAV